MNQCPICETVAEIIEDSSKEIYHIRCPRCGYFRITEDCFDDNFDSNIPTTSSRSRQRANISGWLLEQKDFLITNDNFESLTSIKTPKFPERADKILLNLEKNTDYIGKFIPRTSEWLSWGWCVNESELFEILRNLERNNYIEQTTSKNFKSCKINPEGLARCEKLRQDSTTCKKAFMAMKFNDPELDAVIDVLKGYVKQAGFDLRSLLDEPRAGLIDNRLRVEIQSSDFLVADLTHDNLGAYWEAGYAEGLGKPVIYICKKDKFEQTKTHFDTSHHLTISWDKNNLSEAGVSLKAAIRATLPHLANIED